jgi:hypothetical protein
MKELHIRLREEEFEYVSREAERRNITISEYIRLLIQSHTEDNKTAKAKLLLSSLPAHKRTRICQQILKKDKRKGQLEPYVEGILSKNPKAKAKEIYKALSDTFGVPITPNIRKMIRRVKEKFRKRGKN